MDLVLRSVLGGALLWAAVAKGRRPVAWREGVEAHGVSGVVGVAVRWGVPLAEAVVGALLVAGVATRAAAVAACVLLATFAVSLLRLRATGLRHVRCGCFGGPAERPTWLLAAREIVLLALGLPLALGLDLSGRPSAEAVILAALGVLGAVVAVLGALVLALYRQVGVLHLRLGPRAPLELAEEGPPLGAPAPPLDGLAAAGRQLVVFLSAGCRLCRELEPGVRALAREGLPVRVVDGGREQTAMAAWNVPGTPFAVQVVDGVVRSKGLPNTLEELDRLVAVGDARRPRVAAD